MFKTNNVGLRPLCIQLHLDSQRPQWHYPWICIYEGAIITDALTGTSQAIYTSQVIHVQIHNVEVGRFRLGGGRYMTNITSTITSYTRSFSDHVWVTFRLRICLKQIMYIFVYPSYILVDAMALAALLLGALCPFSWFQPLSLT